MKTKSFFLVLVCLFYLGSSKCLAIENESFTIGWNVLKAGDIKSIELNYDGAISINWGDNQVEDSVTSIGKNQIFSHEYTSAGKFNFTITGGDITHIKCDSKKVLDLTLTNVPNLEYLSVKSGKIKTLDISKLSKLETFYCDGNEIQEIDLSKNILLESVNLSDNKLTDVDLSKLDKLKKAYLNENMIKKVSVCNIGALSYLKCSDCELDSKSISNLFESLPKLGTKNNSPNLFIEGNPGVEEDKIYDLPKTKNWLLDVNVEEVKLSIDAPSVKVGETFKFSILMSSKYDVKGIEFDLVLPDSVNINKELIDVCCDEDGLSCEINKNISKNSYRILIFSLKSKFIKPKNGKILSFVIPAKDSIIFDKDIKIEEAVIGDSNDESMEVDVSNAKYEVLPNDGDVNGDCLLNITDIMCLVDIINEVDDENVFITAADLDKNGEYNILDILLLIDNIMLSDDYNRSVQVCKSNRSVSVNENSLYFKENKDGDIDLCMKNNTDVFAFQIDLSLDKEIKIRDESFELNSKRVKDFNSVMRCIDEKNNIHRLLVYTMDKNRSFIASDINKEESDLVIGSLEVVNKGYINKKCNINSEKSLLVLQKNRTISSGNYSSIYTSESTNTVTVTKTNGNLKVLSNGNVKQLLLYNALGQIIKRSSIDNFKLQKGIYFLVVKFEDGKEIKKKILIS